MSLPERPHRDSAPTVDGNDVYEVVAGQEPDAHLEFPPEQPAQRRQEPVFVIEPAPNVVQRQAQHEPLDPELVRSDLEIFGDAFRNVIPHWERPRVPSVLDPRTLLPIVRRKMVATLAAARHLASWAFVALRFSVIGTYGAARRMTSRLAHGISRAGARVRGAAGSVRIAGMSRIRAVRTPRVRARLIRNVGALHISLRLPTPNRTLMVFIGGTAVGAVIMWFVGMPSTPAVLTNSPVTVSSSPVTVSSAATTPKPTADDRGATVYTAVPVIMPISGELQPLSGERETTPSSVPTAAVAESPVVTAAPAVSGAPAVAGAPAITVTSMPAGARVTVDGIGWGETPVTIHYLPPGQKVIRVSKEGYQSEQRIVSVADDPQSAAVRVALRTRN